MPFVVIGAAAMAVHGVTRSTRDLDLLTVAAECLAADFWHDVTAAGAHVDVRRGDAEDPLAGVVRVSASGHAPVDIVVGKARWHEAAFTRATEASIDGVTVPVAGVIDLVLLKLYAGGPLDAWDVEQLLHQPDHRAIVADIDVAVGALPPDSRALWARVRGAIIPPS